MKNERKRVTTRLVAGLLAVLVAGAGLALTSSSAGATQNVYTARTSGIDLYATSALAATKSHSGGSNAIVLVSGADANWPDGLPASALAGSVGGPVILTDPDSLQGSTANAIATVDAAVAGAATIHLVGGTAAISANVNSQLVDLGYTTKRHSGDDRVATAVAVAEYIETLGTIGSFDGGKAVILATGDNFPDALAVGALAYGQNIPIVLVRGGALSAGTTAFLDSETNAIKQVIVVGGTSAVSADVVTAVEAIKNGAVALEVTRVSGATRYDTAVEIAKLMRRSTTLDGFGLTITGVILVDGATSGNALTASAMAGNGTSAEAGNALFTARGADSQVILLTEGGSDTLNSATETYMASIKSVIGFVRAVGGTSSVSAAALTAADTATTQSTPTVTISALEGASSVTFTYSEKMNSTAIGLKTDYTVNNAAVTGTGYGVTVNAAKTVATLTLGQTVGGTNDTLSVSDVVCAAANANNAGTANTAKTCVTVANDATGPTATAGKALIGSTNAYITFDSAVSGFACGDLTGSGIGCSSVTKNAYSNTWAIVADDTIASGDTFTMTTSGVTDTAGNAGTGTLIITASSDSTKPTLKTAAISSTSVIAATATMTGGTGQYNVKGDTGGIAAGELFEAWSVEGLAGTTSLSVTINAVDKTIVVTTPLTAGYTKSASAVVSHLNADATFSANFTAAVTTIGTVDAATGAQTPGGGQSTHTIALTMSESMAPSLWASNGTPAVSLDANADGTVDSNTTDTCASFNWEAGTATCTVVVITASEKLTAGTSKLHVANTATDLKGNATTATLGYGVLLS